MNIPTSLKYARTDEWVMVDGDVATIGITDFAQEQLSDIVYIEYRVDVGDQVKKNSVCVTLESVKAAADVNLPVSGKVIEVNENLPQNMSDVNEDPFGKAWMVKVEMSDPNEINTLLDASEYQKRIEEGNH